MLRKIAEKFVLNKRIKAMKVLPLARIPCQHNVRPSVCPFVLLSLRLFPALLCQLIIAARCGSLWVQFLKLAFVGHTSASTPGVFISIFIFIFVFAFIMVRIFVLIVFLIRRELLLFRSGIVLSTMSLITRQFFRHWFCRACREH